jgi:hypothetical protein
VVAGWGERELADELAGLGVEDACVRLTTFASKVEGRS